jgi:sugar lactone lactonase YvrE
MTTDDLFLSRPYTPPHAFTDGIEGPACDAAGNLYAVNYARQGTIGRATPAGEMEGPPDLSVFVELPEGSIGNGIRFNRAGDMLIADYTGHTVLKVDMRSRAVSVYAHDPSLYQPNDLAIGADDIVYASDPHWDTSVGRLWRVRLGGGFELLEDGMGTTNGLEVSPDEGTLYVNETVQRRVWAYDLSPRGEVSRKRLLIEFPEGWLDGMRCDVDGNLYVTRWGLGRVAKLSPQGEVLREIRLAGLNCTNLTFGGPDGRTCYVTVADTGQIERFRADQPGRDWLLHRRQAA